MKRVTHALTMNGRIHGELRDRLDSPEEIIQKRLMLLDGAKRYSLSLWRLPTEIPFDRLNPIHWPQEYIQVAGSRDSMTVEIRRFEDGVPRQCVVGHAVDLPALSDTKAVVLWNGCKTEVFPSEVFGVDEVITLFVAYYGTNGVPDTYRLRLLGSFGQLSS